MQILLTGAAGFVGSHVLRYILDNTDHSVVCLMRLNNAGDLNRFERIVDIKKYDSRLKIIYHDLKFTINQFIAEQIGPLDVILHLAANSHVDRSITSPKEFFEDNVLGTVNLLEFARVHHPKVRFINFSTDEVFGPAPQGYKFKEDDRFRPSNPYSASKAGQIEAGYAYHRTYGMDIISTFTMNIFGPRQNPEKLIPKAVKCAQERKPMPVFAELRDGELVGVGSRHWLHVDNVGDALVFLIKNGVSGEYYNIVGTDELTNEDIVRKINNLLGYEPLIEFVDFHKTRPGHDRRYALDGGKLAKLGWTPKIGFDEGIKSVVKLCVE